MATPQMITETLGEPLQPIRTTPTGRPPLPTPVDVAQASDPAAGAGLSFTEGLRDRRAKLERLRGNVESLKEFQQGEGAANLAAIEGFERVPGQRPSEIIRATLGVEDVSRDLLSEASRREIAGLEAITAFIRQEQSDQLNRSSVSMEQRRLAADDLDKGRVWDEATQTYRAATPDDYLITPTGEQFTDEQKAASRLTGEAAILEVKRQAGDLWKTLTKGVSVKNMAAFAEEILRSGGVSEFRKTALFDSLLDETELTEMDQVKDIRQALGTAAASFETRTGGPGTGPIADLPLVGKFFDIFSADTAELKAQAEKVKTMYAQLISGKVISDKEIERLRRFLPDPKKTETRNVQDIERLQKDIQINLELFERGKREGLSANEAFDKYGAEFGLIEGETDTNTVKVISPSGERGTIDRSELDEALKNGWKEQ